jgi:hypothetical protein
MANSALHLPKGRLSNPQRFAALALVAGVLLIIGMAVWNENRSSVTGDHAAGESLIERIGTDIGVSFVIFGLLAFTFEGQANRIREETISYIGNSVLGAHLYPAFERLNRQKFARSHIEFEMSMAEIVRDHVVLKFIYSYRVRNLSDSKETYNMDVEDDALTDPAIRDYIAEHKPQFIWGSESATVPEVKPNAKQRSIVRSMSREMEPKEEKTFVARWTHAGRLSDHYDFFMSYVSTGASVRVLYPEEFDPTAVILSSTAKLKEKRMLEGDKLWQTVDTGLAGQATTLPDQPTLFPGQAFTIKWTHLGARPSS